jgi:uncharacterized protein
MKRPSDRAVIVAAARAVAVAAVVALLLGVGAAVAAPPGSGAAGAVPPVPVRWVTDGAGFLSPAVAEQLDERLRSYQARTGHQVIVWIGRSTGGAALEDFTVRAFAAWKVGRKGMDDGLAIFVFADDRKVRFEVGYGLEGQVPDAIASRIINEVMVPRLAAGDPNGALTAGVDATMAVIDGRPWSEVFGGGAGHGGELGGSNLTAPQEPSAYPGAARGRPPARPPSLLVTIFKGVLIAAVLLFLITHPSLALYLLLSIMSGRGGGGGGWGGGDGGGFSGGGGRSGGGGASGSW